MKDQSQLTNTQKAHLYDFAIENALLDPKALYAEISTQLRASTRAIERLEAISAESGFSINGRAPHAPRKSKTAATDAKQTAAIQRSRKLQGKYLALVRQFPEGERPQYSELAKSKGRRAAITAMKAALVAAGQQ